MKVLRNKYFYQILILFAIGMFLFQNSRLIRVNFAFWNLLEVNLLFLLIIFFIIGATFGFLACLKIKYKKPAPEIKKTSETEAAPPGSNY